MSQLTATIRRVEANDELRWRQLWDGYVRFYAPRTQRILERHGFELIPVDTQEVAKAEGGLTCCSLLVTSAREMLTP